MAKITFRPGDNNPEIEKIKGLIHESLFFLCTQFLGYKDWESPGVHDDLERFLRKPAKKKALLLPRNHLKSTFATISVAIHEIIKNPNIRILIGNGVWDISRTFLSEIKAQLEGSQLKYLFGDFVSARWNADEIIVRQRTKALKEPTIMTTGVEAETTGGHYDLIILDDLIGLQNSLTPEQRSKVKRFRRSMINLLEPKGGKLLEIGTRWHLDDTFSEIFEKEMRYYDVMIRRVVEKDAAGKPKLIFPKKFAQKFDPVRKDWTAVDDPYCMDYVEHLRASMPLDEFSCTPAETPILMSDWKTKPIEHVQVGDEIIGFTLGEGRKNGGLVKTRVKRTFSKQDQVLKLIMKSGRTVLCTKDHRWWTGRSQFDESHPSYAPAKIGSELSFVCSVEDKSMSVREELDWNYLAGLFDGEGSAKSGGCLTLSQCESVNPHVYASIVNVMNRLGIEYGSNVRDKYDQKNRKNSPVNTSFWIKDSFNVGLNLIRRTSCAKSPQIAERFFSKGKKFTREWDEIIDIKYESMSTVYALETETGNYVAWGYASSNSQYMNEPFSSENQLFKPEMFRYWNERPKNLYLAMTADLAISEARYADETAIGVCGMDKDWKLYILDYIKGRWRPSEIVSNIFNTWEKWKPHTVGMETNGFQRTLKLACEEEMRKRRQFFSIEEIKNGPEKSKEQRIKTLEPAYRDGRVYHAAWMKGKDLEEQLQTFPKGKHDDIIDMVSMSLPLLAPGVSTHESTEDDWDRAMKMAQMFHRRNEGFFNYGR